MKLTHVEILNSLGCRHFVADLKAPITLLAGANGSGKSSILQSIKFALTGEMPRISLKKDGEQLVTDGAKTGTISVEWNDGGKAVIGLPSCKLIEGNSGDIHPAMAFLTDMHRFSSVSHNDRRAFLFGLTGTTASNEEVKQRLLVKKADPAKIDAILPLLRSGFPAAHDEAKAKARDAKAQWKEITGETYGDKKAEGWQAETGFSEDNAESEARTRQELVTLDTDLQKTNQKMGELQARVIAAAEKAKKSVDLRDKADRLGRISTKLESDRHDLAKWEKKVETAKRAAHCIGAAQKVCACPECGAEVIWTGEALIPHGDLRGDEDAACRLGEYTRARDLMASAVKNGERDLIVANEAAAALAAINEVAAPVTTEEIDVVKSRIESIRQNIDAGRVKLDRLRTEMRKTAEAEGKTKKAQQNHRDVASWLLIADALAPDGIPGELLSQALNPINSALAQSAVDTGWRPVTIDAEMQIRAGGRLYGLLSESEQWRTDAMLTAAIALISGVKLALFDRLDVLDLPARGVALGWFGVLAEAGEIHTLIVAGTLKALPALPREFQGFWMDSGSSKIALKEAA